VSLSEQWICMYDDRHLGPIYFVKTFFYFHFLKFVFILTCTLLANKNMWDSWSEPLWWREDKVLTRDDAFLQIMKTILLHFIVSKTNAHNCSLQESIISLLARKINTTIKKWKYKMFPQSKCVLRSLTSYIQLNPQINTGQICKRKWLRDNEIAPYE
jgi:hypothetical protein